MVESASYMMRPNLGSFTMSLSSCLRFLWIIAIVLHEATFITAVLPSPPVNLIASDITPSSLKLKWKPAGNPDEIQHYVVQYKMKDDPGDFRNIPRIRKTEYNVEQLQPFRQYEFRVLAVTEVSRSLPSTPIEVVTGEVGGYHRSKYKRISDFT